MPIKLKRNGNLVSQCILRLKRIWIAWISWDLLAPLNISNSGDVLSEWGLVDEREVLLNSISKLYLVFEKEKRPKNAMLLLGHLWWSVNPSLTRRLPFPLMDSWCKIADCLRDRLANLYWVSNKDKLTKQIPRQRQRQIWQIGQIGKLILSYWQKILRSEVLSENDDI